MIPRSFRVPLLGVALVTALYGQPDAPRPNAAPPGPAQPYLDAFAEWRKLDPALEREAATAGAQGTERVSRVLAAVTIYNAARSAYMRSLADESGQLLLWIQNSATGGEIDLAPVKVEQSLVSVATELVNRDIAIYAKDTDRGFVQLRQALERERAALGELDKAIAARAKAWSKARELLDPSEDLRAQALDQYQMLSTGYSSAAAEAEREEPSWTAYYQALSSAISRPIPPPAPAPVVTATSNPASNAGAPLRPGGGNVPGASNANTEPPAPLTIAGVRIMNPANPDLVRAPASATPAEAPKLPTASPKPEFSAASPPPPAASSGVTPSVALGRYVGEWTYPTSGGMYFGVQPESIALQVNEQSGHVTGSMAGRFKVPAGTTPEIQLTFTGDLRATRNQVFNAEASDGAKGTLELIPGNAYNLLEVNFRTEPKPGKITLVNFVVVKK